MEDFNKNRIIEKKINYTLVAYDIMENGHYMKRSFLTDRKISLTEARRKAKKHHDTVIIKSVKLQHYTITYHITLIDLINNSKVVHTKNDPAITADQI